MNAQTAQHLGILISYEFSTGGEVSEFVSTPGDTPPPDNGLYARSEWVGLASSVGHPILLESAMATSYGTTSTGTIARRGHPVPVAVRWDKVVKSALDNSEVSRTPEEYALAPADASIGFTFGAPGTDEYVIVENLTVVTPLVDTW